MRLSSGGYGGPRADDQCGKVWRAGATTWASQCKMGTDTPAARLKIEWKEAGGPAVVSPRRQGYGSSVINDLLTYEFGGRVDLLYATEGFRCTIELPANAATLV